MQLNLHDLLPILVIQITLQLAALGHLFYKKKTANLSVWIWAAIIIFGSLLGAILYFAFGRSDE